MSYRRGDLPEMVWPNAEVVANTPSLLLSYCPLFSPERKGFSSRGVKSLVGPEASSKRVSAEALFMKVEIDPLLWDRL
jgi:hypothetical protein